MFIFELLKHPFSAYRLQTCAQPLKMLFEGKVKEKFASKQLKCK